MYALITILNLMLIVGWIVLSVLALVQLRRASLPETARALWAGMIVVIPLAGAIAFWIVRPGQESEVPPEVHRLS
jgi:hypothetical protein